MAKEPITNLDYQESNSIRTDSIQNAELNHYATWLNPVVLAVGQAAPVGTEVDGDRYIVGTGTGAFLGWDGRMAVKRAGAWQSFVPPTAGVPIVKNLADGADWEYVGAAWSAKTVGGAVADGDYGDIVVSGSGAAWLLDWTSSTFDDDATLAANSSTRLPTQQAVKSAIAAAVAGLAWKQAVRVASVTNGTLATAYEAGDTLNGVVLVAGDRILLKDQTTASENGIYVVQASGAPVRATDADSGAELVNASVYVSEGSADADTQWTCTTNAPITVGSTSLVFAKLTAGGGGLTNFTEGVNTASPNATAPYVYLIPNNGATRVDIALVPKSVNGAFSLAVADGSLTGGNKRGTAAVDLQLVRASAGNVASGASSALIGGESNTAGGASATNAGGNGNSVSASRAFNGGGQSNAVSGVAAANIGGTSNSASANGAVTLGGSNNTASGLASVAHGTLANTRSIYNARAMGCAANNQVLEVPLYAATTNATPTILRSDSSAAAATNQYALPSSRSAMVRVRVIARQSAGTGTGDSAAWDIAVLIKNIAGLTSIVGSPTLTALFADSGASTWAVAVTADNTLDVLNVTVTGEASKTIQWTAQVIGPES